jgi:hypothetical protein
VSSRRSIRTPRQARERSPRRSVVLSLSTALLALVVANLVFSARAVAALEVDQQQTTLNSDLMLAIGWESHQVLGQVVRSGIAGVLTQVDLPVGCGPSSDLALQIVDSTGSPGTTVLASQSISGLDSTTDWRSFAITGRPFMPADTLFGIVLSSSGNCGISFGESDPYPRGIGWYQADPNPPGVWVPSQADIGFKTYVERMCKVPRLLELSEQEAQALIEGYGCTAGKTTRAFSRTVPEGQTISQGQPEGTLLPPGSAVDFVVSRGVPCKVPNVRGKKLAVARASIRKARCSVGKVTRKRSTHAARGKVLSQRPKAGAEVPRGTTVSLFVGKGRTR